MRDDLNKLLCERERVGHSDKFHNYRGLKKFNPQSDIDVGGRESMKKRYQTGYNTKSFNENLNPLYGIVRKAVGRKWDKFYSELCKTFNMNSVINQHILVHLDQYVEHKGVYVDADGDLYVRGKYGGPDRAIKGSSTEYYVDPRDGILKRNKWFRNYKAINRENIAKAQREKAKVFRDLGDGTVLHNIDGVWFQFTMTTVPAVKVTYERPASTAADQKFKVHTFSSKEKYWEQLTEQERQRIGVKKLHSEPVTDEFYGTRVYFDETRKICVDCGYKNAPYNAFKTRKYHADKQTASHKMLKKAGIV